MYIYVYIVCIRYNGVCLIRCIRKVTMVMSYLFITLHSIVCPDRCSTSDSNKNRHPIDLKKFAIIIFNIDCVLPLKVYIFDCPHEYLFIFKASAFYYIHTYIYTQVVLFNGIKYKHLSVSSLERLKVTIIVVY